MPPIKAYHPFYPLVSAETVTIRDRDRGQFFSLPFVKTRPIATESRHDLLADPRARTPGHHRFDRHGTRLIT